MIAPDVDGDIFSDENDNCILTANPWQTDTDEDGYGNYCDPDFNNDGIINFADLAMFKPAFLTDEPLFDLNRDGIVNFGDVAIVKSFFLLPPGPSGHH